MLSEKTIPFKDFLMNFTSFQEQYRLKFEDVKEDQRFLRVPPPKVGESSYFDMEMVYQNSKQFIYDVKRKFQFEADFDSIYVENLTYLN